MAGFRSVGEFVDSAEGGKNWISSFRKSIPATGNVWIDISSGGGSYPPNYFASSPLVGALMPENRGIHTQSAGVNKYIKDFTVMIQANSVTDNTKDGAQTILCDYLMYYPFVDLTLTDRQDFENPVTLPRYIDGRGVNVLMVMQSSNGNYSSVNMTMNYTNQDGVAKSVTGNLMFASVNTSMIFPPALSGANVSNGPFFPLAIGDTGVRSIQSVQLAGDWGGLAAFVLVKPLVGVYNAQGARRTTTGNLDSFGSPMQHTNILHSASGAFIEDGAYLSPIVRLSAVAGGGAVVGTLETVWN